MTTEEAKESPRAEKTEAAGFHMNMRPDEFIAKWAGVESGKTFAVLVTGYSMGPFLLDRRSVVHVEKDEGARLQRGDIALFLSRGKKVTLHRVLRILPDGNYLMNGDSQCWTEEARPEWVLARVTAINRTGRGFIPARGFTQIALWRVWAFLLPVRGFICRVWQCIKVLKKRFAKNKGESA